MRLIDRFREIFMPVEAGADVLLLDVEHEAETIETAAKHIITQVEKEITVSLPQNVQDALARLTAARQTNADLMSENEKLTGQLNDATAANSQKDQQIADLTQQLNDANSQLAEIENDLLTLSPAPAPAPDPNVDTNAEPVPSSEPSAATVQ